MASENFQTTPVLTLSDTLFENDSSKILKRIIDIIISLFVIVFILSWLIPILYFLIKFESKGPLIFRQYRNGLNGEKFVCLKFRSMEMNNLSDKIQTTFGDTRITKIGKLIRKTSIDEVPQFFNVLKVEMTVVGPRPHMVSQTEKFKKEIYNFDSRHFAKPGITGLAQVKGCRGEIKVHKEIKDRLRYDLFYIEKRNIFLDFKIVFLTLLNIFKGEEKAF